MITVASAPVVDNQNTMTAGPRAPALLRDVWFLEKLDHFDREVIPERRIRRRQVHGDVSWMSSETLLFIAALINNSHKERSEHHE